MSNCPQPLFVLLNIDLVAVALRGDVAQGGLFQVGYADGPTISSDNGAVDIHQSRSDFVGRPRASLTVEVRAD